MNVDESGSGQTYKWDSFLSSVSPVCQHITHYNIERGKRVKMRGEYNSPAFPFSIAERKNFKTENTNKNRKKEISRLASCCSSSSPQPL
ncbi:unnamed protein product [Linum trigynum]|uniref:Uncharacterized protein n=1 Tax=Linum trigynum TaxID=586398 RepID=A0AAV2FJ50_9ROSI